MMNRLRYMYRNQRFNPTLPIGLILNDLYFTKVGIRNFVKEGALVFAGKVLDVGCGTKPYRSLFSCASYTGLDLDNEKNRLAGMADFFYDGTSMPFVNEEFDHIITTEVIEHVADPHAFMKEIHRVLKSGGEVLLTMPFVWHEHGVPYDYQRFTSYGIENLMSKIGFTRVSGKKILDGPELFVVLWVVYMNDTISNLIRKLGNSRLLSIIFYLLMRPIVLLFNILTFLLSFFPRDKNLYFNNTVLYRKV